MIPSNHYYIIAPKIRRNLILPALTQSKLISSRILPQDPNYDRWVDDLNDLILRAQEPSDVDVSIIIPIHDIAPDYINDAIKSIENQVVDGKPIVIHDSMAGLSGNAVSVDSMNRPPMQIKPDPYRVICKPISQVGPLSRW